MLPELAQICLILCLIIAVLQGILGLLDRTSSSDVSTISELSNIIRPASYVQLFLVAIAYIILTHAFITHDFSVLYAANNSNLDQPLIYRISGVWGAHEGSLLLWVLIQSIWAALVARYSSAIPDYFRNKVLAVLGLVNAGFLSFMLFTSNPFERVLPAPLNGRELNPLLQDPGLAIHPPMLYIGYVGFSVAFAFAVAALITGDLNAKWSRWVRPWTNAAWVFLTIGITLGSWWAYYELGWGGWWFWDPVENASFMPWLVGTALLHSLAVTEKRGAFIAWTVLLSIFTFSLSLLGTFLVRSGILTSVHAFASDPERGLFILIFLCFVIGGSLSLYAARAANIRSSVGFSSLSRETALLLNNIFLVTTAFMVFLGTLFPLLLEGLGKGKISVGEPYFNLWFIILTIPLALLVGMGSSSRWKTDNIGRFASPSVRLFGISALLASVTTWLMSSSFKVPFSVTALLGICLAFWVTSWCVYGFIENAKNKSGLQKFKQSASFYGMTIAHLGIALFILGVTHVTVYSQEKNLTMKPGDSFEIASHQFTFEGVAKVLENNYRANEGKFSVNKNDSLITVLKPQKRFYQSGGNAMTEAAIDSSPIRDLYVSLGEPIKNKNGDFTEEWTVRIYYKSFVVCIWLGGFIMALGGLIAMFDRRYRKGGQSNEVSAA